MRINSDTYPVDTELALMTRWLPFANARVLELGCGRARWTRQIAEDFPVQSIIATEVDRIQHEKNLAIVDLPKVSFRYGGAEHIELPDASVDIVIMLKSLHHVPVGLLPKAWDEIHRVLVPGGVAYISEPIYEGDFNAILSLFNDERVVRQAAFDSVCQVVAEGRFISVVEEFFNSETRFADFKEFEDRILFATHLNKTISSDLHQRIRAAFMPHWDGQCAVFFNPQRVDLLRKL